MTPWTLAALGLALYALGASLQIWATWLSRGLTDLTYKALWLMVAGPGLVAYAAWQTQHPVIVAMTAAPALLASACLFLRGRDSYRNWRRKL